MLDWSKLFSIVFVTVVLALTVFFLVSTIVVAVKGKRKCNAFDVILRIVATLAFIAATAMFACSVLTMLNGDFRIAFVLGADGALSPVFVINGNATELPLADLFIALSSTVGSELTAALFICSLVALIVDCLVANKKPDKSGKAKTAKTPEQIKRDAELEKIRRIGESAVKKTNAAANAANAETTEAVGENHSDPQEEQPAEPDWREDRSEKPTEFVGLNHEATDDGFDRFDDGFEEPEQVDSDVSDEENADAEQDVAEQADGQADEEVYGGADVDENTENTDSDADGDLDAFIDEFFAEDEANTVGGADEYNEAADEQTTQEDDERNSPEDEAWYAQGNDDDTADYEQSEGDIAESDATYTQAPQANAVEDDQTADDEHIEPNRDIYIPQMRTVVKDNSELQTSVTATSERRSSVRTETVKTETARSGGAKRGGAKRTAQSGTRAAQSGAKSKKPKPAQIPAEKKLPVTRRYVILDRRNAVNMFGEYLKDRNQTDKEKLKSSINTIIIE